MQIQLRLPRRADELPFVDARYLQIITSQKACGVETKYAEITLEQRTRPGDLFSHHIISSSWIVHMYRTGLLVDIMNPILLLNSWSVELQSCLRVYVCVCVCVWGGGGGGIWGV